MPRKDRGYYVVGDDAELYKVSAQSAAACSLVIERLAQLLRGYEVFADKNFP